MRYLPILLQAQRRCFAVHCLLEKQRYIKICRRRCHHRAQASGRRSSMRKATEWPQVSREIVDWLQRGSRVDPARSFAWRRSRYLPSMIRQPSNHASNPRYPLHQGPPISFASHPRGYSQRPTRVSSALSAVPCCRSSAWRPKNIDEMVEARNKEQAPNTALRLEHLNCKVICK